MKTNEQAARRIARAHNRRLKLGFAGNGKLVFGPDGSGGAWYSDGSYGFGADALVVRMRQQRMTVADAVEIINQSEASR